MKDLRADRDGFIGLVVLVILVVGLLVLVVGNVTILGFNLDSWIWDKLGSVFGGLFGKWW